MRIEELINKNVEDIESIIPKIDEKIRKRRKRTLMITTSIASIVFSFFLYKSVLVPQYEAFQKRKQIKIADQLSKDYRLELTSILNDGIVEPEEHNRLITIKKALPDLEGKYEPLGVKRDFAPLEKKITKGERIYQAELERKRWVALVDKEFIKYKSAFEIILVGGVDKEKRKQLDKITGSLEKLAERYRSLNDDHGIRSTNKLDSKVNLVAVKFDLNEKLETEKDKYTSLARGGFSISEEESLRQILHHLGILSFRYTEFGLKTNSLDDLFKDVEKGIEVVKVKKYDKQKVDYYTGRLQHVNKYAKSEKYNLVHKEIKNLAYKLKKENFPSAGLVFNKVKNYSYFKLVKVNAKYEIKKVEGGYYKEVWVSPKYESKKVINPLAPLGKIIKWLDGTQSRNTVLDKWEIENKVKIRDGHYKKIWVNEPQYKRVLVQEAHYQKLQIFPLSGKQTIAN